MNPFVSRPREVEGHKQTNTLYQQKDPVRNQARRIFTVQLKGIHPEIANQKQIIHTMHSKTSMRF